MSASLTGSVALVTGASSGIGRAVALELASAGSTVVAGARRGDRLSDLAQEIKALGGRCEPVHLDVSDEDDCRSVVRNAAASFGSIDILVNNAGVMLTGPIEGADTDDWRRMFSVNVLGMMYMVRQSLPHLLASKGTIVQISSVAGRVARIGQGAYAATKWAVNAFSESLRQEVTERGVRVITIEPGATATELVSHITHHATRAQAEEWVATIRTLQPQDVAAAVLFGLLQPSHVCVNEITVRPTDQQR